MNHLSFFLCMVIILASPLGWAKKNTNSCQTQINPSTPTIIGSVINDEETPVIGVFASIALPGANPQSVKTDKKGCFYLTTIANKKVLPISLEIKRKEESQLLLRIVERCDFRNDPVCLLQPIKIQSPNTVYLLPFDGEETNKVFMSRQFRSALAKRFISNLQELEGESVIRKLKAKKSKEKFQKLKAPGLKLYKRTQLKNIDIADFEKLEKLGNDLNALALISGSSALDDENDTMYMSSFYHVPNEETWTLDDEIKRKKLKNMVLLSRVLNPQWTYYTMMAISKREFAEASASPNRTKELKRVKAYLQAQRNQIDSRGKIDQTELLDLLCEVRKALNENCGKLFLAND